MYKSKYNSPSNITVATLPISAMPLKGSTVLLSSYFGRMRQMNGELVVDAKSREEDCVEWNPWIYFDVETKTTSKAMQIEERTLQE